MKILSFCVLATVACGCLSASSPRSAKLWDLAYQGEPPAAVASAASFGSARLQQVTVAPPADGRSFLVRRADGSVAFDAYNEFAAAPALLMRSLAFEAATKSGLFSSVVPSASSASADTALEITVMRFDLDCRQEGQRLAEVELIARLVRKGTILGSARTAATASAESGDYGKAFSEAASRALAEAFAAMRK